MCLCVSVFVIVCIRVRACVCEHPGVGERWRESVVCVYVRC